MGFPFIVTQDLNRRELQLPVELEGEINLLMLGYAEWQQQQYESWLPSAIRLEEKHATFRYYELPVADRVNPLNRFFIDEGMRAGIISPAVRARVLTLYVDRTSFNSQIGVLTMREITLLLVGRDGHLQRGPRWRRTLHPYWHTARRRDDDPYHRRQSRDRL